MTIPHDTLFKVLSLFNARAPLCTLLNSATFLKVQESDVNENSDKKVRKRYNYFCNEGPPSRQSIICEIFMKLTKSIFTYDLRMDGMM